MGPRSRVSAPGCMTYHASELRGAVAAICRPLVCRAGETEAHDVTPASRYRLVAPVTGHSGCAAARFDRVPFRPDSSAGNAAATVHSASRCDCRIEHLQSVAHGEGARRFEHFSRVASARNGQALARSAPDACACLSHAEGVRHPVRSESEFLMCRRDGGAGKDAQGQARANQQWLEHEVPSSSWRHTLPSDQFALRRARHHWLPPGAVFSADFVAPVKTNLGTVVALNLARFSRARLPRRAARRAARGSRLP